MDLKEIIEIFKRQQKIFFLIVFVFVALGFCVFVLQPVRYSTNLLLNVTRNGVQQTQDYRYDDFYRLQADERFADTVVRWLGSPRIRQDIAAQAGVAATDFENEIVAKRLSSQMVEITFKTRDINGGKKVAAAIDKVLNRQTEKLNAEQKEETWFKLVLEKPIISLAKISFGKIMLAFLALGIFFGIWTAMLKHYFSK